MALFLSAIIHQGDELFSVHSRGKQCAFMSLSALLTARNIPLTAWSFTTFNNVLIQGDKMYLRALNNGLLVLDPGVEFLSIANLPTIVAVNSNSCVEVAQNMNNLPVKVAQNTNNLPVEVAQNMNNLPVVVEVDQNTNNLPVEVPQNTNNLPVEVVQNTNNLPMEVDQNTNNLPVEVVQNTNNLPVEVAQNTNNLPVEVVQNTNNLPVEVVQNTNNLPVEVVQNTNNLPVEVVQNINSDLPIVVESIEAQNSIDLPIVLEEQIRKNENQIWFITYGKELQGLVITDQEIEFPYYDIHTALLNIFLNDSHAILILGINKANE